MNYYTHHSPAYYHIRSFVRFVFYTALMFGFILFLRELADDDRPRCNVKLREDFTWEWSGQPQDLNSCVHPEYTILYPDFRYQWSQDSP